MKQYTSYMFEKCHKLFSLLKKKFIKLPLKFAKINIMEKFLFKIIYIVIIFVKILRKIFSRMMIVRGFSWLFIMTPRTKVEDELKMQEEHTMSSTTTERRIQNGKPTGR